MQPPILIVEDDLKIARIIKAYLEGADFRVIHADTARAALEKAEAELPLAVILDLGLPDKSGEELCQELKDLGSFPVIMLTAKSSEEERITGFALGADDYVVKPASPRELVYRVKAVLKRYDGAGAGEHPISFNNGTLILDSRRHTVTCRGESCSVTPTEIQVVASAGSLSRPDLQPG
jgi:Response regulators consisting of a CheY-like receiver domain and a winged-helix DNA-binding domain